MLLTYMTVYVVNISFVFIILFDYDCYIVCKYIRATTTVYQTHFGKMSVFYCCVQGRRKLNCRSRQNTAVPPPLYTHN